MSRPSPILDWLSSSRHASPVMRYLHLKEVVCFPASEIVQDIDICSDRTFPGIYTCRFLLLRPFTSQRCACDCICRSFQKTVTRAIHRAPHNNTSPLQPGRSDYRRTVHRSSPCLHSSHRSHSERGSQICLGVRFLFVPLAVLRLPVISSLIRQSSKRVHREC
jgi:hypothetical protein